MSVIELSTELESFVQAEATEQGVSENRYVETLLLETAGRRRQASEFRAEISRRVSALDAGRSVDGEDVMARLIAGLPLP